MTDIEDATVTLTFPKDKCKEITFNGAKFYTIDTGMTVEELMLMLMNYSVKREPIGAVTKGDRE